MTSGVFQRKNEKSCQLVYVVLQLRPGDVRQRRGPGRSGGRMAREGGASTPACGKRREQQQIQDTTGIKGRCADSSKNTPTSCPQIVKFSIKIAPLSVGPLEDAK